jgi:hypothetical protein
MRDLAAEVGNNPTANVSGFGERSSGQGSYDADKELHRG